MARRNPHLRTPGARALGMALRAARENTGRTGAWLAAQVGKSGAWVTRLEAGEVLLTTDVVANVCGVLGLRPNETERLIAQTRDLGPSPWTPSADIPHQAKVLAGYERESKAVTELALMTLPGLLHTPEYAAALIEDHRYGHDADEMLRARLARQSVLDAAEPSYSVFLAETALVIPVGGHRVMAAQLAKVAALTSRVKIRVIPHSAGAFVSMVSPFTLLQFAVTRPIVYHEHLATGTYLDKRQDTTPYIGVVDRLSEVAMGETESVDLIADHQRRHADRS